MTPWVRVGMNRIGGLPGAGLACDLAMEPRERLPAAGVDHQGRHVVEEVVAGGPVDRQGGVEGFPVGEGLLHQQQPGFGGLRAVLFGHDKRTLQIVLVRHDGFTGSSVYSTSGFGTPVSGRDVKT